MEARVCKKCLLRDMPEADYFKYLYNYIDHLDNEIKASGELYESRLALCMNCEHFLTGMCRKCGCFVELRAIIADQECPDSTKKW